MTILQHTGPCYTLGIASSTPIAEDRTWLSSPHPSLSAAHSKRLTHWFRCYCRVPWGNGVHQFKVFTHLQRGIVAVQVLTGTHR